MSKAPLIERRVRVFEEFRIALYPIEWILWPVWRGGQWNDAKSINLGPLRITWRWYIQTVWE